MWHRSLEQAIEFACRLINDGCDVYGFDVGSLANSITRGAQEGGLDIGSSTSESSGPEQATWAIKSRGRAIEQIRIARSLA
jgi:hypothetical protein